MNNVIGSARVSVQLNGTSLFVVFEGTEQEIVDGYNTLWQVNAIGANAELEWLHAGQAVAITSVERFKSGLFNRAFLRALDNPEACRAAKGSKGGGALKDFARAQAEKQWEALPSVRIIRPDAVIAPYVYRMQLKSATPEWQCERVDGNVD